MPYLPEAVESILTQSMPDFELIVVNDGSTDDTQHYLGQIADRRLRVITQPTGGPGASANRGIALARGKYIARMDADDISLPTRLERQVNFLRRNNTVILVGAQLAFLSNGRTIAAPRMPQEHQAIVDRFLSGRIGISNPCLMCDAALAKETRYRIAGSGEDVDFALRLAERGKCANLDEILYLYRVHPISASFRSADEIRRGARFSIVTAKARQGGLPEPTFEEFCYEWARQGFRSRVRRSIYDWSFCQYRQSIIDRAAGHSIRGSVRLLAAGMCHPIVGLRRLFEAFYYV
jgi:glycosyltransferase involved in cell wall biosynthesis